MAKSTRTSPDPATRPPGRHRRRRAILVGTLIGLALFAAGAWIGFPRLVERQLLAELRQSGVPVQSLHVASVGIGSAAITGLQLGERGELAAGEIIVHYTLPGLIARRVDRVTLRDLRLVARLDGDRLSFGGLPTPGAIANPASTGSSIDLPPIRVERGRIDLTTVLGAVAVLFDGEVTQMPEGVRGSFDARAETPFGNLAGELEATVAADSTIAGQLAVGESRFALGTNAAVATGTISFQLPADRRPRIDANLKLADIAAAGHGFETGAFQLKLDDRQAAATLQLAGEGDSMALAASLSVADPYGAQPAMQASVDATLAHGAGLWSRLRLPQPSAGSLQIQANISGPLPSASMDLSPNRVVPNLRVLLASASYAGGADFVATGLEWPGGASGVDGHVVADIQTIDGAVALTLSTDSRLSLEPAADLAQSAGLPDRLVEPLARPLDIAVTAPLRLQLYPSAAGATLSLGGALDLANAAGAGLALRVDASAELDDSLAPRSAAFGRSEIAIRDLPFDRIVVDRVAWRGRLDMTADGGDGQLHIEASAPSLPVAEGAARGVTLALDADVAITGSDLALRLRGAESMIGIELLAMPQLANALKDLRLPLNAGDAPLLEATLAEGRIAALAWDLRLGRVAAKPAFLVGGPKPVVAAATLDNLALTGDWTADGGVRGAVEFAQSAVTLAGWKLAARNVAGRASFGGGPVELTLDIGELASTAKPGLHLALGVEATGSIVDGRLTFRATGSDARRRLVVVASGEHGLAGGSGRARIKLEPIAFVPGGLQPRDIVPALSPRIESVSGTVGLGGTLQWKGASVSSDIELALKDLSIILPEAELLRINAALAVDSLIPLTTAPEQQIAVGAVNVGVPLTDGLATLRVDVGPRLLLSSARLSFAGGEVTLPALTIDPAASTPPLRLAVTGVDLAQLLALFDLDGLAGTGTLDGTIPVDVAAGGFVVRDAMLSARAPGTLRYAPLEPPAALQAANENISVALEALADFRYSDLRVTLNREVSGEAVVALHVKGNNPNFHDGYPVEFNLNVNVNLDQILKNVVRSYSVPESIQKRVDEVLK